MSGKTQQAKEEEKDEKKRGERQGVVLTQKTTGNSVYPDPNAGSWRNGLGGSRRETAGLEQSKTRRPG